DMDMIRTYLRNLLAHVPWIGNLDLVVYRAIKVAELIGSNVNKNIIITNRTRLNIFVCGNNTVNLVW
ncbi:hypothetical protein EBS02_01845, partial [bacterium]|nr:hypothetical protein [bacterium]